MYAIIATGGKQYKVSEGDVIKVEKLGAEAGSNYVFDQVLDQVENYKEHQSAPRLYSVNTDYYPFMVAEP